MHLLPSRSMARSCRVIAFGLVQLVGPSLLAGVVSAQSIIIHVMDGESRPLRFANVHLAGSLRGVTDTSGTVRLQWPAGTRNLLRVTRIPFAPYEAMLLRPSADTSLEVYLSRSLQSGVSALEAVITTASAHDGLARTGFYDRLQRSVKGAGSGDFITPEELSVRNPSRVSDVLRGRRSISIGRSPNSAARWPVVYGRGGCVMEVLIDGKRMTGGAGGPNGYGFVDDLVSGREVQAIEIYHSSQSTPGEIAPLGGACGTVVIWTGGRD